MKNKLIKQLGLLWLIAFLSVNFCFAQVDITEGIFKIENMHYDNMVLDASVGAKGKVQLWKNLGNSNQYAPSANNQKWRIKKISTNMFIIENVHFKNMVLDASIGAKGKVQLWPNLRNSNQYAPNAFNQKWIIKKVRTGVYTLQNIYFNNMVLDASASVKGKVQLWKNSGNSNQYVPNANNQKWRLVNVGSPLPPKANKDGINAKVVRGKSYYKTKEKSGKSELDKNARRLCTTKTINVDESPQKEIGFLVTSGDHSQIYPGAIFKDNAFTEGTYAKPNLKFNNYNIAGDFASGNAGYSGATVSADANGYVSKATVNQAMTKVLNANRQVRNYTNFSYTVHKIESEKDLAVMAYGEFNGFGASLKAKFNYNRKTKNNMYVVRFHQKYYSFSVDSRNFIDRQQSKDAIKGDDVYVSEVSYGRIGFLRIESNYDEKIIKAAVDAAYKGSGYNLKLGGSVLLS